MWPATVPGGAAGFFGFKGDMRQNILDIEDVARLKKVHPGTVYHWVEKGLLKPINAGRNLFFSRKEIKKWQHPKRGRKPNKKGGD